MHCKVFFQNTAFMQINDPMYYNDSFITGFANGVFYLGTLLSCRLFVIYFCDGVSISHWSY